MSNSTHPQPAFDLLLSVAPDDQPISTSTITDWFIHTENAEKGDNIREHPEIWDSMDIPDVLANLTEDTYVSYCTIGRLNLNALAIGLGLEDVEYTPEEFPGLVYRPNHPDITILLFVDGTMIGFAADSSDSHAVVEKTITRIKELDIHDFSTEEPDITTHTVAELTSDEVA